MSTTQYLGWCKRIPVKKFAFVVSVALALILFALFLFSYHHTSALIKRGDIVKPSPTGNFTIVLWNRSPRTPYAKILVEMRNTVSLRRLYFGVMPYPDQHPEDTGGGFDGHYRESHSYDLPSGTYDVIVHELKTKTVSVQKVNIPRKGKWVLQISFDNDLMDILSPYPHFSIEQGTDVNAIL